MTLSQIVHLVLNGCRDPDGIFGKQRRSIAYEARCETGVHDAMKDKDRISEDEHKGRIARRPRNALSRKPLNKNAPDASLQPLRSLETATKKRRAQKKRAADTAAISTETISSETISDETLPGR